MLNKEDYFEIKDFLNRRVHDINITENLHREKNRKEKTKYALPNAESYGWMPSISICYSFNIDGHNTMYMIPFLSFYRYLSEFLPLALNKHPGLFGTKNAEDVISALYDVSGYDTIGNINAYKQYLIDNAYCYFLLRNEKKQISDKVFRLDLFRYILPNNNNSWDFTGGLMHAYCHCSLEGKKLSSGNGETIMNDLWELPIILGKAILLDENSNNDLLSTHRK